jgi:hypothetical protein
VPAVPSSVFAPIWDQFQALIPPVVDTHPYGGHRPRVADRFVFDKLVQVLVLAAAYAKIADGSCSATTIRRDWPRRWRTSPGFGFELPEITIHLDAGYDSGKT